MDSDVYIQNKNFIFDFLNIFVDEDIALIGIIGQTHDNIGEKIEKSKYGKISNINKDKSEIIQFKEINGIYKEVDEVDKTLLITQHDIGFRQDLEESIYFYSVFLSRELINRGYKVVVANQDKPWCLYEYDKNDYYNLEDYKDDCLKRFYYNIDNNYIQRLRQQYPSRALPYNGFVDEFTYGTPTIVNFCCAMCNLRIGKFCSIANNVTILLGGEHRPEWVSTYPFDVFLKEYSHRESSTKNKGDIIIGNDVWIGYGTTILSGVTIGDGAVIGTNSLVTKDVPPYSIVGGDPAKIIRYRFDEDTIDKLLKIKWWNFDDKRLQRAIPKLLSGNIDKFIEDQIDNI